jgi:hypothetical protein
MPALAPPAGRARPAAPRLRGALIQKGPIRQFCHFATSISNGIGAGTISYVVIKLAVGKAGEVHPILYGVAVLFVLYFLRGPLESVLL